MELWHVHVAAQHENGELRGLLMSTCTFGAKLKEISLADFLLRLKPHHAVNFRECAMTDVEESAFRKIKNMLMYTEFQRKRQPDDTQLFFLNKSVIN